MRMVAHGAMATAGKVENELQHYVPLGSIVMCVDPYGKKTLEVLIIYSWGKGIWRVKGDINIP